MSVPQFTLDHHDFDRAAKALEKQGFDAAAGVTVGYAIRRSGNVVRKNVRAAMRRHRKTGHLAGNVRVRVTGKGMDTVSTIRSGGKVAHLIEGGVKAHHEPTQGSVLMAIHGGTGARLTTTKGLAVEGFARSVEHPGFGADPYFERGVRASTGEINAILGQSAKTMASELAYRMRGRR